jgi:hypothetical protein
VDGHLSHARPDEGNDGTAGLANGLALVVAPVEVLPHLLQVMLYNVFSPLAKVQHLSLLNLYNSLILSRKAGAQIY